MSDVTQGASEKCQLCQYLLENLAAPEEAVDADHLELWGINIQQSQSGWDDFNFERIPFLKEWGNDERSEKNSFEIYTSSGKYLFATKLSFESQIVEA